MPHASLSPSAEVCSPGQGMNQNSLHATNGHKYNTTEGTGALPALLTSATRDGDYLVLAHGAGRARILASAVQLRKSGKRTWALAIRKRGLYLNGLGPADLDLLGACGFAAPGDQPQPAKPAKRLTQRQPSLTAGQKAALTKGADRLREAAKKAAATRTANRLRAAA